MCSCFPTACPGLLLRIPTSAITSPLVGFSTLVCWAAQVNSCISTSLQCQVVGSRHHVCISPCSPSALLWWDLSVLPATGLRHHEHTFPLAPVCSELSQGIPETVPVACGVTPATWGQVQHMCSPLALGSCLGGTSLQIHALPLSQGTSQAPREPSGPADGGFVGG